MKPKKTYGKMKVEGIFMFSLVFSFSFEMKVFEHSANIVVIS